MNFIPSSKRRCLKSGMTTISQTPMSFCHLKYYSNSCKSMELTSPFCHFLKLIVSKAILFLSLGMSISNNDSSRGDTQKLQDRKFWYPPPLHKHLQISQIEHVAFENISRKKMAILITAIKLQTTLNCHSETDDNTLISSICAGRSKRTTGWYWLKPLLKKNCRSTLSVHMI